eukprot:TRINITY_DN10172_c0_g1_i1.p1 TRINITY_DN10172_c0_g1~~TRINITY_DN10172_c0_g1_i1.p1  ORF type:complete len:171 (-),score=38.62 TRINITY_DN10172_c0_g1_i1:28-540(-)
MPLSCVETSTKLTIANVRGPKDAAVVLLFVGFGILPFLAPEEYQVGTFTNICFFIIASWIGLLSLADSDEAIFDTEAKTVRITRSSITRSRTYVFPLEKLVNAEVTDEEKRGHRVKLEFEDGVTTTLTSVLFVDQKGQQELVDKIIKLTGIDQLEEPTVHYVETTLKKKQ